MLARMSEAPETKSYAGSCHCGKVRFDVDLELGPVTACNCSICSRRGWLLTFVPAERFHLREGEASLTDYQFGHKRIHHLFCSTCGTSAFSRGAGRDGKETVALNVRCLGDVDVTTLAVKHFDGKSL